MAVGVGFRRVLLVMFVLASVGATGCWDRIETSEMSIVGAMAIDEGTEGRIVVSLEIIDAESLAVGAGAGSQQGALVGWMLREEADSVMHAIRSAQRRIPRRIFAGQANTVVFGQNLARQGIKQYLDVFERQNQFRRSIVVSVCDTGAGLLQRPFIEQLPSRTLSGLATHATASGKTTLVTLNEFLRKLAEPGIEPISMHTAGRSTEDEYIKRQGEPVEQTKPGVIRDQPLQADREIEGLLDPSSPVLDPISESGTAETVPGVTIVLGIAVFRGDRVVGVLDGKDARGFLWAAGRVNGGTFALQNPMGNGTVTYEVIRSRASVSCEILQDSIRISIEISPVLEIAELHNGESLSIEGAVKMLEQAADEYILAEVQNTLRIVQHEFRTDIYGFGQAVYRKRPELWRQIEHEWNEQAFPNLEVDVRVSSLLKTAAALLPRIGR